MSYRSRQGEASTRETTAAATAEQSAEAVTLVRPARHASHALP